jgi:hypothetical protein
MEWKNKNIFFEITILTLFIPAQAFRGSSTLGLYFSYWEIYFQKTEEI